ncbi:MAG TPA: conjugal transfer protein TraF [bacterium]|nr:conjugal transfer protein TraF [bacterium]
MKRTLLAAFAVILMPVLALAQAPAVLKLPPSQVNIVAVGMGNAVGADGTLFNATAFNPALLGRAPHGVEAFSLGLNISNDVFGLIDYLDNLNFNPDSAFKSIADGYNTSNSAEVNQGLGEIQDFLKHLTDKAVQAGVGGNVAVRLDKHFGIQVYNSTHAFTQVWQGNLSQAILGIPLDSNSDTNIQAVYNAMSNSIQAGLDESLSSSQQSSVSSDIAALKNGTESLDTFKQNVGSTLSGVDTEALGKNILNHLTDDMGILTALVYIDTVAMATYSFQPVEKELPGLTVGANLKIVNRHMAYDRFSFNNSNIGDTFKDEITASTTRWGFDLGALYELPNLPLDLGLSILDLFHQGASETAPSNSLLAGFMSDPAPTMVNLAASYHPIPDLRLNGEVDDIFSSSSLYTGDASASRIKLGATYTLGGFFNARLGFGNQNLSLGAGVLAGFFGLDYSYGADDLSQAYNHYAQMRFVF